MAQIGRYDIIEELGRGGFATVYKARDTQLNRLVALKMLHHSFSSDPAFAHRFQQEAETLANLRHPNIVVIYDVGDLEQRLFIAMEYLKGQNLQQYLEEVGKPLSVAQAIPILNSLGAALDYAHRRGIVHRDIKPSNVMVEEGDGKPRFVLTDFGLVKAMENTAAVTRTGQTLGSPEYMAPEQADPNRRHEFGPPTDLYAFGIMAYQMLAGRVPFPGNSISTLFAHVNLEVPSPQEINDTLTDNVAACLTRMLAKAPGERFDSCGAFVTALDRPPVSGPEEHLGELYEQFSQALIDENWFQVLMLGGQIQGLDPGDRDVTKYIIRAKEALSQPRYEESTTSRLQKPRKTLDISDTKPVKNKPEDNNIWVNPKTGKEMVHIPAGPFLFGENNEKRELPEFWIDKTPVTNAEYARFVSEMGVKPPRHWEGKKEPPADLADHPVVWMTKEQAFAFAEWSGGHLPSEEQWEKAARGTDGRRYPWGNDWDDDRCNSEESDIGKTTQVNRFSPRGASPYGCLDMIGNVWEWTSTIEGKRFIIKGGSFFSSKVATNTISRAYEFLFGRLDVRGFRTVVDDIGR